MSMKYIRDYYNVPAKKGMRIQAFFKKYVNDETFKWVFAFEGKITSASHYIHCNGIPFHPTEGIVYYSDDGHILLDTRENSNKLNTTNFFEKENKWEWVKKFFSKAFEESPYSKNNEEGEFETSDGGIGKNSVLMWVSDKMLDPLYWTGDEWLEVNKLDRNKHQLAYKAAWGE